MMVIGRQIPIWADAVGELWFAGNPCDRTPEDMTTMEAVSLAAQPIAPFPQTALENKPSLIGLTRAELAQALVEKGVPERQVKMRVQQVWHWLYIRGVSDFSDMLNVSKDLRELLRNDASDAEIAGAIAAAWRARGDRGAEERARTPDRQALAPQSSLRQNPHLEMHTRGG